jgi:NlpC/P60 family protein
MTDELKCSVELLERLLGDPQLRRRFRNDAASVLSEAGLPELAAGLGQGGRALMTLEMRESRSSLAGVMVAAAAEGVDLANFAEHAAPALSRDAGSAIHHLMQQPHHAAPAPAHEAAAPAPVKPNFDAPAETPALAHAPKAPRPEDAAGNHPGGHAGSRRSGGAPVSHHQPSDVAPAPAVPEPADGGLVYPGDQATPQQLAAWMGAHAERAGLPPELPVMAALTESGLRNLSYGDRDSVGFFQMRLGIWDQGAYAGYPSNPQLQIQWFIDHAVAVKNQYPELAGNPNRWGQLVADVEQPAQEYRSRYQLQLSSAQALLHGADLTSGAPAPPAAPAPPPVPVGQAALKVAMHFTRGGHSGSSLDTGPTSAEMVQYAYAQQGVQIPKVAAQQFDVGIPVSERQLKAGDAVFFAERDGYVDHVGLYVGNGRFVTAAPAGGGVTLASIDAPPFGGHYIGARRFTAQALGNPARYARPLPTIKGP